MKKKYNLKFNAQFTLGSERVLTERFFAALDLRYEMFAKVVSIRTR